MLLNDTNFAAFEKNQLRALYANTLTNLMCVFEHVHMPSTSTYTSMYVRMIHACVYAYMCAYIFSGSCKLVHAHIHNMCGCVV